MDKAQSIHSFWSGFGLSAYDENTVPTGKDAPNMPYVTYSVTTDSLGSVVQLSGSLWYRSTSWAEISKKADEISEYIGVGGKVLKLDSGYVWVVRGQPFAQRMSDNSDETVRRIYINLQAEFLTAN